MSSNSGSRGRTGWLALLGLLLLGGLAGAGWWGYERIQSGRNPAGQYLTAAVQRTDIQDLVTAMGTLQPRDFVDVGAQVSGQLKKLHVEVGSLVEAGELLAEIDPIVLRANVDARRAGLRNQQATLRERESNLELARIQARRQRNLLAESATTAEAVQQAEAALRASIAQIEALKAQIEQTESTLRADEANLNYARIVAPLSGTVVSLTARQGQTLNANQSAPTVLRIADLSTMTVQTQVSETDVGKLRVGMPVWFTTLGSQGRRWSGTLKKVEPTPTVTNNVVLFNATFDVPNTGNALLPSMTAQVYFVAASARDALLVPTAAVTMAGARRPAGADGERTREGPMRARGPAGGPGESRGAGESRGPGESRGTGEARGSRTGDAPVIRRGLVRVIDSAGVIAEREVTLGIGNRVQQQVLSGLQEGETVVTGQRQQGGSAVRTGSGPLNPGMPPGIPGPRGR